MKDAERFSSRTDRTALLFRFFRRAARIMRRKREEVYPGDVVHQFFAERAAMHVQMI